MFICVNIAYQLYCTRQRANTRKQTWQFQTICIYIYVYINLKHAVAQIMGIESKNTETVSTKLGFDFEK